MRIIAGLSDAGWHDLRDSGAYEWWYFDALSEDGRTGVVLIWFAGLPFSPDYLTDHERRRSPRAIDHVAMFAAVYRDGRQLCYALNRYSPDAFDADREGLRVGVGPNTISHPGSIELSLDAPILFGGSRLTGDLSFAPRGLLARDALSTDGHDDHVWNPIAPSCAVTGTLQLFDRKGEPSWSCELRGEGYLDHNYGVRPLTEGIARWHWGRAHLGDETVVFYSTDPSSGPSESFLLLHSADGSIRAPEPVAFDARGWRRRPLCPRFPTETETTADGARITTSVRHVLDWGPFYMRFLADFAVDLDGRRLERPGIVEYLDPRGLRKRWLRPLIKTRIRKR